MELSPEILQKLQNIELDILIEFDKACRTLGINYTISAGTLLGAVRHHGFIPWDDDIDVAILREDYDKFLDQGQVLLPDHLFIQTYETDRNYPNNFAKIRDTSTVLKEYGTKNLNMKNGVYIDIFYIDTVSRNRVLRMIGNLTLTFIHVIKYSCTKEFATRSSSRIIGIIRILLLPIAKIIGTRILNRLETYIKERNNMKHNTLTYCDQTTIAPHRRKDKMLVPIDVFNDYTEIIFEGHSFMAIKEWDLYLSSFYGQYMTLPPVEQRVSCHDICEIEVNEIS